MLNLDELKRIIESLEELDPNPEIFNWGPGYEMALERKREALSLLKAEIKLIHKKKSRTKAHADTGYQFYVRKCEKDQITPMSYDKWKTNHREQDPSMKRWKKAKSAPSLWEKRDKDPVYASNMRSTLGTQWGIGKPRGPK